MHYKQAESTKPVRINRIDILSWCDFKRKLIFSTELNRFMMKEGLLQQLSSIVEQAMTQLNLVNSSEAKQRLRQILTQQLASLDLVSQQEFEQQQQVIQRLQQQLEEMEQALTQLEKQLQQPSAE